MEVRELTYGERMVGLTFNPSDNQEVHELKKMYATIIDKLHSFEIPDRGCGDILDMIETARTSLITSQMWAVKAITYKD